MTRAPLAISCGEPAGIGPEIAVKAWQILKDEMTAVWLGDPRHLPAQTPFEVVQSPADAASVMPRALPVLPVRFAAEAQPGIANLQNAKGVMEAIAAGVDLVCADDCAALVTAPINKKILKDGAAFAYPGHTEYLAALAGPDYKPVMMLASDALKVVPATIHIPLDEVPQALTPEVLTDVIRITDEGLRQHFGVARPRIAIAGLNPHAGEGGAIGKQEVDWIAQLVTDIAATGIDVTGPWPADTMFHAAARKGYDAAIAMYHDQALIPIKTLDFDRGVNVTLGLPFIRTSPDHGTAFDIAGQGIANPTSMIEACKFAWHMAHRGR